MLRLCCETKKYAWGQPGATSLVADLAAHADGAVESIDPSAPYAELWMGVHVSGPSVLSRTKQLLSDWLAQHPAALGSAVLQHYGKTLPFLFKVLSVKTALSIQSHPDKSLARQLHAQQPDVYKDANHKPEMAIAVNHFEALCGFCEIREIAGHLRRNPELAECLGNGSVVARLQRASLSVSESERRDALRAAFTALMTCDAGTVSRASRALRDRLAATTSRCSKDALFLRVFDQYPEDVGTLAVFFLNHLRLRDGQAIYLAANEPHAYLSGELIEAMASSDNVIRAGLTPKLRDTEVLCSSLTYDQGLPHVLEGDRVSPGVCLYQPPFEEFQVLQLAVQEAGTLDLPPRPCPIVLLALHVTGMHTLQATSVPFAADDLEMLVTMHRGQVLFVPANVGLRVHSVCAAGPGGCRLQAYAATVNDSISVSAAELAAGMHRSATTKSLRSGIVRRSSFELEKTRSAIYPLAISSATL